jgi:peptide/nickel transport system substrate-binding protein
MARAESNAIPSRFPYDSATRSVVALDAQTVQITFAEPFAPWAATLFSFLLPRHILEPVYAQEGTLDQAAWNRAPTVGSGPYVYGGEDGGDLLFDANPLYWQGRPAIDRVRLRAAAAPAARWAAMTAGSADMAAFLWPEPLPDLIPPDNVRLLASPSGYVETLYFNLDPRSGHPALQDARVRAALAQALDRQALCQALSASRARPALTLFSGTVFEDPTTALPSASLVEANRQLDDAGWRDSDGDGIRDRQGIALTLRYAAPPRQAADPLVDMLQAAGVGVLVTQEQQPWENPAAWDLARWAEQPAGYPDPDDPRWLCVEARPGGHNPAGVCNEELDGLLIAQARTVDPDERAALLFQVQALARAQALWVPLCRWEDIWAARADLEGPQPWRGAPLWNISAWRP